jgi:hypothetical protein
MAGVRLQTKYLRGLSTMVFYNKSEFLAYLSTSMKFFLGFTLLSLLSPILGATWWHPFKNNSYGYPLPWLVIRVIDINDKKIEVFWPGALINMLIFFCACFIFALGYRIIMKEERIT